MFGASPIGEGREMVIIPVWGDEGLWSWSEDSGGRARRGDELRCRDRRARLRGDG